MTCRQCRRLLSPHLDNALAADERSGVLAHLAQCSACAERLHQFESNRQLLRALPTAEISKDMELLLQSRIHHLESQVPSLKPLNQTTRDSYTTLTACDFTARR